MLHKTRIIIVLVVVMLTVAGGLLYIASSRQHQPTVTIGYLNITASLPLFIAEANGYFSHEGVRYKSIPFATSNQLVDSIASGNINLFIEASAVPLLALESQAPGRVKVFSVSAITPATPFDALLVPTSSSIQSLQDLAGKRIGVFPGTTAGALLRRFLANNGVDTATLVMVPVPPELQLTALQNNSVDALHSYEPTVAIALNRGDVKKLYGSVYAQMLTPNPQGVAAISVDFLRRNSATAAATVRALERAMLYMRTNEAGAKEILSRRLRLDAAVTATTTFLYMLPHTEIDSNIFQRYADMLREIGELKAPIDVRDILYKGDL
jgi:ABC-type nitrate/sulfonate/bicarbonate transport system substrate-binding protein